MDNQLKSKIISRIEDLLSVKVTSTSIPPQGMGSDVFFVTTEKNNEYAIKIGGLDITDIQAYKLIQESGLEIPVPKLFGNFQLEEKIVMILQKVNETLLENVPQNELGEYIVPMLSTLQKIHSVESSKAGFLNGFDGEKSWKKILLFKYSGKHPWFDWEEILQRDGLDSFLIRKSIEKLVQSINQTDLPENSFSLLHTDFNQRNLFVNPKTKEISAIIDWGEAMFGDPLYDFARVRMFIKHFDLPEKSLLEYYDFLQMTEDEKGREEIYFYSQVIDYRAWYSEELNDFNRGRINLHQRILQEWLENTVSGFPSSRI